MFAGAGPDEAMLAAVRRARAAGIRTGLISNSWGAATYDRALLAELFDGVVISGDVGVRKPTPEIYAMGARADRPRAGRLRVRRRPALQPQARPGDGDGDGAPRRGGADDRGAGGAAGGRSSRDQRAGRARRAGWRWCWRSPAAAARAPCQPVSCAPTRGASARWRPSASNAIPTPQVPSQGAVLPAPRDRGAAARGHRAVGDAPRRRLAECTSQRRARRPSRSSRRCSPR